MKSHGGMSERKTSGDGPSAAATEATEAEARDHDDHDDDTTEGEAVKLETTMLNRAGSRRVVLLDDDQRDYYGIPARTRAGRFRSPLAWAVAAARVAWGAVTGKPDDDADDHAAAPMETR
jgi:hypothetical protein